MNPPLQRDLSKRLFTTIFLKGTTMLKKSALIIAMSLAAGSAFAHAIPAPIGGGPYTINEQPLIGSNNNYSALNIIVNNAQFGSVMFDVTAAGDLDIFADDHNNLDAEVGNSIYVFKLDADGLDWTLTNYTDVAPRKAVVNSPQNIYGIDITDYVPGAPYDSGSSDPGLTAAFSIGTYLAMYNSGFSDIAYNGTQWDALAAGAKLSTGFLTDIYPTSLQPIDIYVRASANSTAALVPAVEAPAQVPVPGAIWLMGSVLAGFGAFGRKKAIAA